LKVAFFTIAVFVPSSIRVFFGDSVRLGDNSQPDTTLVETVTEKILGPTSVV